MVAPASGGSVPVPCPVVSSAESGAGSRSEGLVVDDLVAQ